MAMGVAPTPSLLRRKIWTPSSDYNWADYPVHVRPGSFMSSTLTTRTMSSESDKFVRLLTDCQSRLYAYILSILPNSSAARDVLAEANIKLWRKWQEFEQDRDFATWAF